MLQAAEKAGQTAGLSAALAPWRKPLPAHDPGGTLLDQTVTVALGGDCLAHVLRGGRSPGCSGRWPLIRLTMSRLFTTLAANAPAALRAIGTACAGERETAWTSGGEHSLDHSISARNPLIIGLDATLVTAPSEKEGGTYVQKGFGSPPVLRLRRPRPGGYRRPLAWALLRATRAATPPLTTSRSSLRRCGSYRAHRI